VNAALVKNVFSTNFVTARTVQQTVSNFARYKFVKRLTRLKFHVYGLYFHQFQYSLKLAINATQDVY